MHKAPAGQRLLLPPRGGLCVEKRKGEYYRFAYRSSAASAFVSGTSPALLP